MNRFPLWKNLLVVFVLLVGVLYSVPNLFGEAPAVQVSSLKSTIEVTTGSMKQALDVLAKAKIKVEKSEIDSTGLKVQLASHTDQDKAAELLQAAFGTHYVVAQFSAPKTPDWLRAVKGKPMALGLDLRGGVYFLMELDMKAALEKTMEGHARDVRISLKERKIRPLSIRRQGQSVVVRFRDASDLKVAFGVLQSRLAGISLTQSSVADEFSIEAKLSAAELAAVRSQAVEQNIATLRKRVNELGVNEPVIQQQGAERIAVQLPGIKDTARAKAIIGRTASLEVRLVMDDQLGAALAGNIPTGGELLTEPGRGGAPTPILVKKDVELTGDNIVTANLGYDENGGAAVNVTLDAAGGAIFRQVTSENMKKRMAMLLIENGSAEVITAPSINAVLGEKFIITGNFSAKDASDTALLLRAGSLKAPMHIIEERTIGASLGEENIARGFHSTWIGFSLVALLMVVYYRIFGVISVVSLAVNVLLLVALLSSLGATLTLPGMAAIALALGMAIDSNVLINERIREELRIGMTPQMAISEGYKHAWDTILDSNVTSLIVGLALLIFGNGPVRGFAVVHCLGILTSMFSSVVVSRSLVNLVYGARKKLKSLSI